MTVTAQDIAEEHRAALASLTRAQRLAIERLARARRLSAFNQRRPEENLEGLFHSEAEQRTASTAVHLAA